MSDEDRAAAQPEIPKALVDLVLGSFALPDAFPFEDLERLFSNAAPLVAPAAAVALANLRSAVAVCSVPFLMAQTAALQMRYRQLLIAEQIRQRRYRMANEEITDEMQQEAGAKAGKRLDEERSSPASIQNLADQCIYSLGSLVSEPSFKAAAEELLLETVVMFWGALEVFLATVIRTELNADPTVALKLIASEGTKKHFPSRGIALEALAEHAFDVSTSMGEILLADRHLDSLPVIKDIANVLWPGNTDLRDRLNDPGLWKFAQRRHLMVHRRGDVDADYIAHTGEAHAVGSRLTIKSDYVAECFGLVCGVVSAVLKCHQKPDDIIRPAQRAATPAR
jgi:hypothetical protein